MLTYIEKFKDRTPQDTINIIENYFHSLDMNVKQLILRQSISGTWYCRLELQYRENPILAQNGKGTSKEYCLASGYGELYERFCSHFYFLGDPFLYNSIINCRYNELNFYFDPEEKEITFQEAFSSNPGQMFLKAFKDKDNLIEKYFNRLVQNKYIGVPFINSANPKDKKYFDPRITMYLHGSSGLACGNSYFEAFIQGMSEIYEHSITRRYWIEPQEKYYYLDLSKITNPLLLNIISNIQEENELYIIDFSYNFNIPVLMSLIVNKTTHSISVNLGSSPIFEIALERVLTELYQGFDSFKDTKNIGQFPAVGACDYRIKGTIWHSSEVLCPIFPEFIFERFEFIEQYNNKVFLTGSYDNEFLANYLIELNLKNNFNIYYYNKSGCKDMYAIELFDISGPQYLVNLEAIQDMSTEEEIHQVIDMVIQFYDLMERYFDTNDFNLNKFLEVSKLLESLPYKDQCHFNYLISGNWFCRTNSPAFIVYELSDLALTLFKGKKEILDKNCPLIEAFYHNPYIYQALVTYAILNRYARANYKLEELLFIFNFLRLEYSAEDIINLNNDNYWITKILLADLDNINTPNHKDYIKTLALYKIN